MIPPGPKNSVDTGIIPNLSSNSTNGAAIPIGPVFVIVYVYNIVSPITLYIYIYILGVATFVRNKLRGLKDCLTGSVITQRLFFTIRIMTFSMMSHLYYPIIYPTTPWIIYSYYKNTSSIRYFFN